MWFKACHDYPHYSWIWIRILLFATIHTHDRTPIAVFVLMMESKPTTHNCCGYSCMMHWLGSGSSSVLSEAAQNIQNRRKWSMSVSILPTNKMQKKSLKPDFHKIYEFFIKKSMLLIDFFCGARIFHHCGASEASMCTRCRRWSCSASTRVVLE